MTSRSAHARRLDAITHVAHRERFGQGGPLFLAHMRGHVLERGPFPLHLYIIATDALGPFALTMQTREPVGPQGLQTGRVQIAAIGAIAHQQVAGIQCGHQFGLEEPALMGTERTVGDALQSSGIEVEHRHQLHDRESTSGGLIGRLGESGPDWPTYRAVAPKWHPPR